MKARIFLFLFIVPMILSVQSQNIAYQRPPHEIEELALAKISPAVSFSETNNWMLHLERNRYLSLEELARPELKLAGLRIAPANRFYSKQRGYLSAVFVEVAGKRNIPVTGLPANGRIITYAWYPNTDEVLLFVDEGDGTYLYHASVEQPGVRKISGRKINAVNGIQIVWINETDFIITTVPMGQGNPPQKPPVPVGPKAQENDGRKSATRTYQDLLKDEYDEALFDYYFTSQLVRFTTDGEQEIGNPAIYSNISISPDRNYLLNRVICKPYSYILPIYNFPTDTYITDLKGSKVKSLASIPLYIPLIGYDTTSPYPRGFAWRPDKPATVYWTEAQDEGNPKENKVEFMDVVYQLQAPFTDQKEEVLKTSLRFQGITWGNDRLAIYSEGSSATRRTRTYTFSPGIKNNTPELLFDLSRDDNYNNPGYPLTVKNEYNRRVLYTVNNKELLMISQGASPEGNMPYISRFNIAKKQNKILWRCKAPYYEQIYRVTNPERLQMITIKQSVEEPSNYYFRDLKRNKVTALTQFENPYPQMKGVTKEKIRYKRADGVDLTATVYLPAGYDKDKDGPLPVLMWAYPIEYKSSADASQVRGSKYTFTSIGYGSPVFWVARGYCVMDNVEMPIVGEKDTEPNDTFIEQLVMNAEAAVKVVSDMGVGDPERVAVGGHSYGAFMTANLLSHTKLFKAGLARSGAYNRTLTPFGFQAERRTYWQAPDVYNQMSPFMFADKLNGALLLVHGEDDNNSGTFPIQSERYYDALKGHGATVRYVTLPLESHGYAAEENILHLLYETNAWLEKYMK